MKAMVYVQHLLGTGHAVRAASLAEALTQAGVETVLVTGNKLPFAARSEGFRLVDLPHVRVDGLDFKRMIDPAGELVDDAWRERRRDQLLQLFHETEPDILLTETWPFGRKAMAFELEPLVAAARARRPRPLIASSIRDILTQKEKPDTERRFADLALATYDLVLVHGDERFVPLDATFRFMDEIGHLVRYTGYIHNGDRAPEPPPGDGEGEVLVSCGGGAFGHGLLDCAIEAAGLPGQEGRTWRILVGIDMKEEVLTRLRERAPANAIVERAREDFPRLLKRVHVSISQCGYNTSLDVIAAGCPAVLVPYVRSSETEQVQRAEALAARGLALMLREEGLTPQALVEAMERALVTPRAPSDLRMDGPAESARILVEAARRRQASAA